jgi:hypothetical protein
MLVSMRWFHRREVARPGVESAAVADDEEYEFAAPNVSADWATGDDWLLWESPRNFVAGESHYLPALRALTGPVREYGYLRPSEVCFVREADNAYDGNAWRAEVGGRLVGYVRREIAAQLSPPLDRFGCATFTVCGVLRGGSISAPNVGVHVWLNRRTSAGPELVLADSAREVPWPPHEQEGAHHSHDEDHAAGHLRRSSTT